MLIKVEVGSFAVEPSQNIPILILQECGGERTLSMYIGSSEAGAIAITTYQITPDRPLTIDLAQRIMEDLGGTLLRVIINDLVDQVFHAQLHIRCGASLHSIDCRASDAIALALRCRCAVFVEDQVFEKSGSGPTTEGERIRQQLTGQDTLDFGRYFLQ
jgi:hypothetical protein